MQTNLSPWERFDGLNPRNEVQLLQEHSGPFLEIHGINMDAVDIQVGVQNCPAHIGYKLDAKFPHFLVIVLDRPQDVQEMLWDNGIRHPRSLLKTVPVLDGHDTWDDWDGDARLSNSLHPANEEVHVKKHLGEDPRATEVGLCLEVF